MRRVSLPRIVGFTLAEMAIVVLIMGIAMSMGLKITSALLDNNSYSETKIKADRVKTALIGFLRTNGRLPCPDTAALPTGDEPATGCSGNAANGYGVIPYRTLGISRSDALDGFGNFFTYRVANVRINAASAPFAGPPLHRGQNQDWTSRNVANTSFDISSFTAAAVAPGYQSLLIQNRDPAPGLNDESRNAVVVLLSHGKNGFGAKTTRVAARIAGAAGDELTNATAGTTTFIRRAFTDVAAATGGVYDDVVIFMTPQDLLQPLINEGTLRTCRSYCPASTCTAAGTPTLFCTGNNTPIERPVTCIGVNNPSPYCTGANTPVLPPNPCTAANIPYTFCTGAATFTCVAANVPVGVFAPTCP